MKKTIWIIVAVVIIIAVFAVLSKNTDQGTSEKTIKIGALLILSGDIAVYGEGAKQGVELAVDDFKNKYPDVNVDVVYEDTHGEAKSAVSSYQKLVSIDKVDGILGPLFQTQVGAVTPLIQKDNIPTIAISPLPKDQRTNNKNPLSFWPDPTIESASMADYVYSQGIRKVGVLGTKDSWEMEVTEGFVNRFKELGGNITDLQIILPDDSDVRVPLSKIISSKPEAIYLGTYMQFIRATRVIRELGFKGNLFSIEVDTYLAEETKSHTEGLQFVSLDLYSNNFSNRIESKYGTRPNIPVGQAYDATMILLTTLNESDTKDEVLSSLKNLKSYNGVSGNVTFYENNHAEFQTPIFELKDGKIIKVE